uniref:Myb-like domain-containing protein n=1 Tax=Haptolina ericina TaxID=156174 RepID=A0A7S3AIM6_9EUKA|eukprot:CAMPEP_0181217868 /NCGR_PEP_ID=MMETSP1096-20121128/27381_1 /TAXON_ID=156174 ORGANISM="Chrysochromulina ericina, Strain CCMP281" /NCGR_SAMPLE_ID=MMETSP1096 /ASSEMBLY_ACC=CAM_ASM_000453 /LENGTH=312 /DNA_ID=CAMNT_0023310029 /DNA_START=67 /DNA_END=1005 /DNA_ORIENTATION=-
MGKQEMVAWQPQDDLTVLSLYKQLGPRWRSIAERLPGRSVASVRNRYLRMADAENKKAQGQQGRNRCQLCNELKRGHICKKKMGLVVYPARMPVLPRATAVVSTVDDTVPIASNASASSAASSIAPGLYLPTMSTDSSTMSAFHRSENTGMLGMFDDLETNADVADAGVATETSTVVTHDVATKNEAVETDAMECTQAPAPANNVPLNLCDLLTDNSLFTTSRAATSSCSGSEIQQDGHLDVAGLEAGVGRVAAARCPGVEEAALVLAHSLPNSPVERKAGFGVGVHLIAPMESSFIRHVSSPRLQPGAAAA